MRIIQVNGRFSNKGIFPFTATVIAPSIEEAIFMVEERINETLGSTLGESCANIVGVTGLKDARILSYGLDLDLIRKHCSLAA